MTGFVPVFVFLAQAKSSEQPGKNAGLYFEAASRRLFCYLNVFPFNHHRLGNVGPAERAEFSLGLLHARLCSVAGSIRLQNRRVVIFLDMKIRITVE